MLGMNGVDVYVRTDTKTQNGERMNAASPRDGEVKPKILKRRNKLSWGTISKNICVGWFHEATAGSQASDEHSVARKRKQTNSVQGQHLESEPRVNITRDRIYAAGSRFRLRSELD